MAILFSFAAAQDPETTVRVTVRLVNVIATVRGPDGALVTNLTRDDFEVSEEGEPQQVRLFSRESELPLAVALLLDASLSTAKDLKFEQDSAVRFIRSVVGPRDRLALFTFTDDVTQASPFTSDVSKLERAVRAVSPRGGTSLFDAIYLASHELERLQGRRVMVLITDGGDTTSTTDFHAALRAAQEADAVIYAVTVVPIRSESGRNVGGENALQLFAEGTGGRRYRPDTARELDPVFTAIGEELRSQYVLGYYAAPNLPARAYRRIEVRVRQPGFAVQARKGYYLP